MCLCSCVLKSTECRYRGKDTALKMKPCSVHASFLLESEMRVCAESRILVHLLHDLYFSWISTFWLDIRQDSDRLQAETRLLVSRRSTQGLFIQLFPPLNGARIWISYNISTHPDRPYFEPRLLIHQWYRCTFCFLISAVNGATILSTSVNGLVWYRADSMWRLRRGRVAC